MSHEEFLARVPIFANCTPEEIAAIAGVAQESFFQPGQIIVTQGTPGQAFYLILSGRVEILRDGVSLGRVSARGTSSARCRCSTKRHARPRSARSTRSRA